MDPNRRIAHDLPHLWLTVLRRMRKTFLYAAGLRVAVGVLKLLLKGGLFNPSKLPRGIAGELFSQNPIKWGALVSGLTAFPALRGTLQHLLGSEHPALSLVAGFIASLPGLVMNVQTRTEMGLYLSMRALHGLFTTFFFPNPMVPSVLRNFNHYDTILMGMTNAFILYGVAFNPDIHSPGYRNFVVRCTMIDPRTLQATGSFHRSQLLPAMMDVCREKNIAPPEGPMDIKSLCRAFHPETESCTKHHVLWLWTHMRRFSLPLYFPLKTLTTLIWHRDQIVQDAVGTATNVLKSVLCSSLFLTLEGAGPYSVLCLFAQLEIRSGWLLWIACTLCSAPPLLLEPKSRRLDLVLFCCMQTLRSGYLLLHQRGYLQRPTSRHVTALYLASMATMLAQYAETPSTIHKNVRSTFAAVLREKKK